MLKNLGVYPRKLAHNVYEVDVPNPKNPGELLSLVVWDFSGKGTILLCFYFYVYLFMHLLISFQQV